MTEPHHPAHHLIDPALDPDAPAATVEHPQLTLAEAFGGPRGLIDSGLPVAAFVVTNVVADLTAAVWAAVGVGLVLLVIRLVRREVVRHTVSGFFGVVFAALLARWTGSARNFFIPGIALNGGYFVLMVGSLLVRRPLIGVVLRQFSDKPPEWHQHPVVRRAYAEVTVLWAAMFGLRLVVQALLYRADETGWLAAAKLGLGYPLFVPVLAVTPLWVKRRTAALSPDAGGGPTDGPDTEGAATDGGDEIGDVSS
ncbi:MAG TPA: DUF3159 domain-containing protein [Mycobacteriales bacterium]|nr:DUF3159 domain-containing protein [Mycobacteriales bacterium]